MTWKQGKQELGQLVFLALPVFLMLVVLELVFPESLDNRVEEASAHIDQVIHRALKIPQFEQYFTEQFLAFEEKLEACQYVPVAVASQVHELKERFPKQIEVIFFDREGLPIPRFCDRQVPKRLLKKFVQEYHELLNRGKPLSKLSLSFQTGFLGILLPADKPIHGRLLAARPLPDEQYVFLSRFRHPTGFILFFRPSGLMQELALSDFVKQLDRDFPTVRVAPALSGQRMGPVLKKLRLSGKLKKPLWQGLMRNPESRIVIGDTLIKKALLMPSMWIVGATRLPPVNRDNIFLRYRFEFFLLPTLLYLLGKVRGRTGKWLFSIRGKMILAFLYCSALPLLIMGIVASQFLSARQDVLEKETFRAIDQTLLGVDLGIRHRMMDLDRLVDNASVFSAPGQTPLEAFQHNFSALKKQFGFDFCLVCDPEGKEVFKYSTPDLPDLFAVRGKVLEQYTLDLVNIIFGTRVDDPGGKTGLVIRRPRAFSVLPFSLGDSNFVVGTWPIGSWDQKLSHLVFTIWDSNHLKRRFLQEHLSEYSRELVNGGVLVRKNVPPYDLFPANSRFLSQLEPYFESIHSPVTSFRKILPMGKYRLLISGFRGTKLAQYSIIGGKLDIELQRELANLRWTFWFVTLTVFGLGGIIGLFLARLFLNPVRALEAGIIAIENRDFSRAIPVESDDELGALALAFNETMADWKDLEVAKEMQERLFPHQTLAVEGFSIFGHCRTASRVGGDFYDFSSLGRSQLFLAVGDVSGHGVGSALVVAMAIALIRQPALQTNPQGLIETLHKTFFAVLEKKKIMSCIIGILDLHTLDLTLSNAGHPFPIRVRDGKAEFVPLVGLPVGSVKRFTASLGTFSLHHGDTVVFYSDGLIEALNLQEESIGYDVFLSELPGLLGSSPESSEGRIREWFSLKTGNKDLADDVTIMVLQGNGATRA